jgi:hydrogenase maturation protease
LAYDLLDGDYGTLILVDCLPTGEEPGSVSVLEVDDEALAEIRDYESTIDSHTMRPEAVLAALYALGGQIDRVLIVGCQPLSVTPGIGLSDTVRQAVDHTVELLVTLATTETKADRVIGSA